MKKVKGHVTFANISNQPKLAFEWLGRTKQKPSAIQHHSVGDRVVLFFNKIGAGYLTDFVQYLTENDNIKPFGAADYHIEEGGKE